MIAQSKHCRVPPFWILTTKPRGRIWSNKRYFTCFSDNFMKTNELVRPPSIKIYLYSFGATPNFDIKQKVKFLFIKNSAKYSHVSNEMALHRLCNLPTLNSNHVIPS